MKAKWSQLFPPSIHNVDGVFAAFTVAQLRLGASLLADNPGGERLRFLVSTGGLPLIQARALGYCQSAGAQLTLRRFDM